MANQLLQSAPARSKLAETRESKAFTLQQRGSTRRRRRWRSLLGRGRSAAARCQDQLIFLKLGFQSVMRKVRELRNCYIRNGGMVAAAAEGDRDRDNINVAWVEPYFSLPVVPPPMSYAPKRLKLEFGLIQRAQGALSKPAKQHGCCVSCGVRFPRAVGFHKKCAA